MYAQNHGTQSPGLSNNPFLSDPNDAHQRFPDLTSSSSAFSASPQQGYSSAQAQQGYGGSYNGYNSTAGLPQSPTFASSNSFGQQQQYPLQSNPTGYGMSPYQNQSQMSYQPTGYGQSQPQQPQQPLQQFPQQTGMGMSGFGQQQQGLQPSYQQYQQPGGGQGYGQAPAMQQQIGYQDVAQFDPYAPQPQQQQQQQQQQQSQQHQRQPSQTQASSSNPSHPREYIRTHKAELEKWDNYAWKQVLGAFDGLKDAWTARKTEAEARMLQVQQDYGFTGQQEVARLAGLRKDAELNADSVAASSYQMHEVFQGYRQSGDVASKRRVREATNAALSNLPDWPAATF
ncbi:hypothetical protein FIBSPDRAFT_822931 [Athelia psychrophila]|uniref:Uncharacterized protein n=1 Tax=Athelia psychrophila TaxID=1759441 RepID=A0A166MAB7_9AGAM|nr:hypothetical protein FIBSPDRAFT_822931 [Fibularhizoctonia sp. CBS 109695]